MIPNMSIDVFSSLPPDCSLQASQGVVDLGCFVSQICGQANNKYVFLLWIIALLPFFMLIIKGVALWMDRVYLRSNGKSIFQIVYFNESKYFYYGWDSFGSFERWLYNLALMVASVCAGFLLVMAGAFMWLNAFLS